MTEIQHDTLIHDSGSEDDDFSDNEAIDVPLNDQHHTSNVNSNKTKKESPTTEKPNRNILLGINKLEKYADLIKECIKSMQELSKQPEAKKKPTKEGKGIPREPDKFSVTRLKAEFVEVHFPTREFINAPELMAMIKNVFFQDKTLVDDDDALQIVTEEELRNHRKALETNAKMFMITEENIPLIMKRLQRLETITVTRHINRNGEVVKVDTEVDLPSIVKMELNAIGAEFVKLNLASISTNLTMICKSLYNAIIKAFPLSKIGMGKPASLFKSLYELGHSEIYQEVKNIDLLEPVGIAYLQVDDKYYITDAARKAKKALATQVTVEGTAYKTSTAIEKLLVAPISEADE